jgi:hypothetical protein
MRALTDQAIKSADPVTEPMAVEKDHPADDQPVPSETPSIPVEPGFFLRALLRALSVWTV